MTNSKNEASLANQKSRTTKPVNDVLNPPERQKTLSQQKADFTAEGAPLPSLVATHPPEMPSDVVPEMPFELVPELPVVPPEEEPKDPNLKEHPNGKKPAKNSAGLL